VAGLLSAATPNLADHVELLGPLPVLGRDEFLAEIANSGLSGRGGAGFPTARKLSALPASGTVVVANGAEGEPASSKDRLLLATAPHLVLDGLVLMARAVGAVSACLYAPPDVLDGAVRRAFAERRDRLRIRLVEAPHGFISGQESAAVQAIGGGPALPTSTPPAVFERGVGGRPTLVQNVETLAHVALIARFGARWFRYRGTPDDPGTRLHTVSGCVRRPGVVELDAGSTLAAIVQAAGGATEPMQAVLVGGYHGGWVPWTTQTAQLQVTARNLARYGAAPGAGVIIGLAGASCGLRAGADLAVYLAGESAGQCGPCRNGMPAVARQLQLLADGRGNARNLQECHRLLDLIEGRGACRHPDGTARLVRSTLQTFAAEVDDHLHGQCSSGMYSPVRMYTR
jgi:NADH:ubiquinone oxidoreductase subunit F (NADH-binding)